MIIHVETLGPDARPFAFDVPFSTLLDNWGHPPELQGWRFDTIAAEGQVQKTPAGIEVRGHVRFECTAICSRCANDIALILEDDVLVYFDATRPPEELELTDGAFDVIAYDGERIDLMQWVSDQAALMLPDHPRCDELSNKACDADVLARLESSDDIDPRWSALRDLLE